MPGATWWIGDPRTVDDAGAVGRAAVLPRGEDAVVDTVYDLSSLTKPLCTALLAVLLEADGVLDLEAPLEEALPDVRGAPVARASLCELAMHRSGLPAWQPLYLAGCDRAAVLGAILAAPLTAPRPTYSDLGYLLLGWAVERAGGDSLEVLFARRVATPLGLAATRFAARGREIAGAAPTEDGNEHERQLAGPAGEGFPFRRGIIRGEVHDGNAWWLGGVAGHAGLFGTAAEVAAIACEILAPTRLPLTEAARARLLHRARDGRTAGFGLASHVRAASGVLPDDAPGHTGFTGTSVWLIPAEPRVLVLLTNRVHPRVDPRGIAPVRRTFHEIAMRNARGRVDPRRAGG